MLETETHTDYPKKKKTKQNKEHTHASIIYNL